MEGSEGGGAIGAWEGGEGGGSGKGMMGGSGSLPPRKRLLAGLKQNGWLTASTSVASPTTPCMVRSPEVGGVEEVQAGERGGEAEGNMEVLVGGGGGGGGVTEGGSDEVGEVMSMEEDCMSCGALESSAWRRVKVSGVVQRLCDSCSALLSKRQCCPLCLAAYPDDRPPTIWLQCCRCQRDVHVECEKKRSSCSQVDMDSYMCPDCAQPKKDKEIVNGVVSNRVKGCIGRVGDSCSLEAGNCASSAAAECSSPCSKKQRVSRDHRSKPCETELADSGNVERVCNDPKAGVGRKVVTSQSAAAAAAAAAAALACIAGKAAAAAKATAVVKAAAAVKAAAVAKAALDAAALAARAESQARAESRRHFLLVEHMNAISNPDSGVPGVAMLNLGDKSQVKLEGEEIQGPPQSSIDDEELARQLHRAINSSPRISRSLTPLRRKTVGKPGTLAASGDSVGAWPRPIATATEPRSQFKQQQTRPRSVSHKDSKRFFETRVARYEFKQAEGESSAHQLGYEVVSDIGIPESSDNPGFQHHHVGLKSEPIDSIASTLSRGDFEIYAHEHASGAAFVTVKAEVDRMDEGGLHGWSNQDNVSALDHLQGAITNDDGSPCEDGEDPDDRLMLSDLQGSRDLQQDDFSQGNALSSQQMDVQYPVETDVHFVIRQSSQNESIMAASDGLSIYEVQEKTNIDNSVDMVKVANGIGIVKTEMWAIHSSAPIGASLQTCTASDLNASGTGSLIEQQDHAAGRCGPFSVEECASEQQSICAKLVGSISDDECDEAEGQYPGTLKALPGGGGKGFASGSHLSSFAAASQLVICAPALASGPTSRHA